MRNNNVTILGTGAYLPSNIVTNEDLCKHIKTTPEWVEDKLGIIERRITVDESTADLAYQAAIRTLENSKVDKEDLDLIIVVTSSPDQISPSTACTLHEMLDIKRDVPSFDINAVCAGFVYAMSFASTLISSGIYKKILIVASETYSKHTNVHDRNCVFFGDGAGGLVLGTSKNGWNVSNIASNGNGSGMTGFRMPLSDPFTMKGKEVWEQAIRVLPESIKLVMEEAELEVSDIKMLVPHQPSINILKVVAKEVGMSMDNVKLVQHKYGNIAGASIPIALNDAFENNEIEKGDKIVLSAVGSGWAWGSMVINYED
jgi:3-oxoacyl-[acyl-carrier-protein] synthase-3